MRKFCANYCLILLLIGSSCSPRVGNIDEYKLEVFADYFQIYMQTASTLESEELGVEWSEKELKRLLQVKKEEFVIGTARNMSVPFFIKIYPEKPEINLDNWDIVNESEIKVTANILYINSMDDEISIPLESGVYGFYTLYKNLDSISKDGLEGDDEYYLYLWKTSKASQTTDVMELK
ncbi:hypothetical protein [Chondrinema litorale]|uniref:hypothetical protein n=1 Tax=Chondrinema litorale TaxID=2994555 RepID=UPI002542C54D|nr:hypothetical protein [Chondrinema litorale]UZR98570.1 hypothetical protein OQ292_32600 [Chondrinema litorale]